MSNGSRSLPIYGLICAALFGTTRAAVAQQKWVSCKPIEAATYPERIHVKCAWAVDNKFWYFAASTTDARAAARALSVIESAQLGDKFVNVLFDPNDQSGATFGCLTSNCRQLLAVMMVEAPLPCTRSCAGTCGGEPDGCGGTCPALSCVGGTCTAGACVCPAGRTNCGNKCVNTSSDKNNCGSCGNSCDVSCSGGHCKQCPAGTRECDCGSGTFCAHTCPAGC